MVVARTFSGLPVTVGSAVVDGGGMHIFWSLSLCGMPVFSVTVRSAAADDDSTDGFLVFLSL